MKAFELRRNAAEKLSRAQKIADGVSAETGLSDEQMAEIQALRAEAKKLQAQAEVMESLDTENQQNKLSDGRLPIRAGALVQVGEDLEATKPFASIGEQCAAIIRHTVAMSRGESAVIDKRLLRLNDLERRALAATGATTTIDQDGGYVLQDDFVAPLMQSAVKTGEILSRVNRVVSATGRMRMPDIDETDISAGAVSGGIRAYWVDAGEAPTSSKPKWQDAALAVKKLAAICYVDEESQDDAPLLTSLINRDAPKAIAWVIEDAIVSGNGAGKPKGFLNSGDITVVAKETLQTAATVVFENVKKMCYRIHSMLNAVVLIHPDLLYQLDTMSFPVGTGGVPVYLPAGGMSVTPYGQIHGRPVIPTDHMAALGTVGDICICDLSQYQIIEKAGGVVASSSMHVAFLTGESVLRFMTRVNGQTVRNSPITIKNSSDTRSNFVVLATRG